MNTKPKKRTVREPYVEPPIPPEALAWPTEPEPQPVDTAKELEGKPFGTLYVGWWMNHHRATGYGSIQSTIGQGCCDTIHHSDRSTTRTDSQDTGRFYATKTDAVLALRWELCRQFAKILHQATTLIP